MIRPPFFYGWLIVAAFAVLAFFGTGMFFYTRGIFLPYLAEDLGTGRFEIALGFSIEAVVVAMFSPLLGRLLDVYSPKQFMLTGVLIVSAGYFVWSSIDALWQFYLTMFLFFGIGMPAMGTLPWGKVVVSWFDENRGFATGIAVMGASLAGMIMPPIANWLTNEFGWRTTLDVYGIMVIIILLPTIFFFIVDHPSGIGEAPDGRPYEPCESPDNSVTTRDLTTGEILQSPQFWVIAIVFGIMLCVVGVMILHLYGHMLDIGLAPHQAALVISTMATAAAVGKPLIGWMSDRIGVRNGTLSSLATLLIALILITQVSGYAGNLLVAALFGLGYSGITVLQNLAISIAFKPQWFARVRGLMQPFMLPFTFSVSPLAGYVHDTFGSYVVAFYILSALALIGLVLSTWLPGKVIKQTVQSD